MITKTPSKKLRINKRKDFMIAHFPADFRQQDMQPPLCFSQDEIVSPTSPEISQEVNKAPARQIAPPWRFTDSFLEPNGQQHRTYLADEEPLESKNYFLIIESKDDVAELIPINEYYRFHLQPSGYSNSHISSDFAEKEYKQNFAKNVDLEEKVSRLKKNESDDESKPKKVKVKSDSIFTDEDYGIKRQEMKQHKQVLKAKYGNKKGSNDYVESALAISNIRDNPGTWDYNEGERSDDEEDFDPVGSQLQENYGNEKILGEDESDSEQETLTGYGKIVKNLLINIANQEVDDELRKYDNDDDETQDPSVTKIEPKQAIEPKAERTEIGVNKPRAQSNLTKEEVESKVIRILMQNMGRISSKAFMSQVKFKKGIHELQLYKDAIKKTCDVENEVINGEKNQFLSLKASYRN